MTLFFYSGGDGDQNEDLDLALVDAVGADRGTITFVPTSSEHAYEDFDIFMDYYGHYGFTDFRMLVVDQLPQAKELDKALAADLIFLGGGNTFHFLYYLRASGLANHLQQFVDAGGIVAGESAGAIVLTNNIATASFPEFDRDENEIGLSDLRGLDLVSFEFFPHYVNRPRYSRELRRYTRLSSRPLLACPDGSGVIVNRKEIRLIGDVYVFYKGSRFQLSELL